MNFYLNAKKQLFTKNNILFPYLTTPNKRVSGRVLKEKDTKPVCFLADQP